jgi:glycerol uptake facilitator-like aquaporin
MAVAEFTGTALLVAAVVGSGIMGERLSGGNDALALLANSLATGAMLVALIFLFAPISGAHFNPAVTLVAWWERTLGWREGVTFIPAQIAGGCLGTIAAHLMFDLAPVTISTHVRSGPGQLFAEFVATFGLLLVIHGTGRDARIVPLTVAAYITAAYWFTASTSFANPAVTIARCMTNTFSGIRPQDVPLFILAQLIGALAATLLFRLWRKGNGS